MNALVHIQDKEDATEEVLVIDFDGLTCINAVASNVNEWGFCLTSDDIGELKKDIGVRVGDDGKLTKARVTAIRGKEAAAVFLRADNKLMDKRRERRNPVSIPVKLADRGGITEIRGRIVDAGANGCRVSAKDLTSLPDEVILTIRKFDKPVLGEFVWRKNTTAGLRLLWDQPVAEI